LDRLGYVTDMKPLVVSIKGEYGFLFAGEYPHTYTFVPLSCVAIDSGCSCKIDKLAYAKTRWGIRNMRFNSVDLIGNRLFPDERKPVLNSDAPGLEEFLGHLRRGYGDRYSEPAIASRNQRLNH
jgi:hypothetical protein